MLLLLSQKRNSLPIKAYVQKKVFPGSNSKPVATAFPRFCRAQVWILHMKSAKIKVSNYFVATKCHCDTYYPKLQKSWHEFSLVQDTDSGVHKPTTKLGAVYIKKNKVLFHPKY